MVSKNRDYFVGATDVDRGGVLEPRDSLARGSGSPGLGKARRLVEVIVEPVLDTKPPGLLGRVQLTVAPESEHCLKDAERDARARVKF